jgi:hypothetical protein
VALKLQEYLSDSVWLCDYPVKYLGTRFNARMSIVRLANDRLLLHSPCEIDAAMRRAISALGEVACLVAPGTFHHLHLASAQAAFPAAQTFICPGVERKRPRLHFDSVLNDSAPEAWAGELDQLVVRGNRWICEVAFFHRGTRTLLLVDLVENFTDRTVDVNWQLKLWLKWVFRMWNTAKPAPEYQLGWGDKQTARVSLNRILEWNFVRVIPAHGELLESRAHEVLSEAWRQVLVTDRA